MEAGIPEIYQHLTICESDISIMFNAMKAEVQPHLDNIEPMKAEAQAQYVKLDNLRANAHLRLDALHLDNEIKI